MERGDLSVARAGFDAAITLDPLFRDAYAHRAVILSLQGEAAKASVDYCESRKSLGPGGTYGATCPCGPVAAKGLRRLAEAARLGQEARGSAIALYLKGDKAGARRKLDSALVADPGDPESYQSRAVVREASGDWRGALDDYEKGLVFAAHRLDFQKGIRASRDELRMKWRGAILADEAARRAVREAAAFAATPKPVSSRESVSLLSQFRHAPVGFALQFALVGLLSMVLVPATLLVAWQRRHELERGDLWAVLVCMVLGLAIRSMADAFPSDIRSATDMGFAIDSSHNWAAGYSFIQHVLFLIFPARLETVCRANILFDLLCVSLIYGLARRLLRDPVAAAGAAAVYAVYPISARFAASDSAHVLVTLCYLASLSLLGVWRREGKFRVLLAAAAWWAFACNVRVEALLFAPAAVLIAKSSRSDWPLRWRHLLLAVLAAAPFLVFPAAGVLSHLRDGHAPLNIAGLFLNPFFMSAVSPIPIIIAALLGVGAALWSPRRRDVLWWLAGVALLSLPSMPPRDAQQTNYRYFLPMLALFAIPAGQGLALAIKAVATLPARPQRSGSASTDFAGQPHPRLHLISLFILMTLIGAGNAPCWGFLRKAWTHQLEFAFVRRNLRGIADGCTIVRRGRFQSDSGLEISPMLSIEAGRNHRWIDTEDFLKAPSLDGCVVYYQAASCHARDGASKSPKPLGMSHILPECEQMQQRFRLEPIAEERLPVVPYVAEIYTENPVPIGFYRIDSSRRSPSRTMHSDTPREPECKR